MFMVLKIDYFFTLNQKMYLNLQPQFLTTISLIENDLWKTKRK